MLETEIKENEVYNVVFDITLKKPGCAILQAMFGCENHMAHLFETDSWLTSPTPDLKAYQIPGDQLKKLVALVNSQYT